MEKINKKILSLTALMAIVCIFVVAGILAYLVDFDEKENVFTFGKVDIKLLEPSVTGEVEEPYGNVFVGDMIPGQEIAKDPQVKNIGNTDAYIYMRVYVPIYLKEENYNNLSEEALQELTEEDYQPTFMLGLLNKLWDEQLDEDNDDYFESLNSRYIKTNEAMTSDVYTLLGAGRNLDGRDWCGFAYPSGVDLSKWTIQGFTYEINDGWTEVVDARTTEGWIESVADRAAEFEQFNVYTYYYNKELKPGETTPPLFNKVKMNENFFGLGSTGNIIEVETDEETGVSKLTCRVNSYARMGINAYAVQSELNTGDTILSNEIINLFKNNAIGLNKFAFVDGN